jgi:O-antigen/teichoic acid export membrane protein
MIQIVLKYLPAGLRNRVEHRHGLTRILDNISWLFFDKILRMGVGLLVGVWVARYLGPEQFGLLNFAMAFVALFGAISTLGLQGIIVRDIVRKPEESNVILGTGFLLQLIGGTAAFLFILVFISYLRPDDNLAKTIVAILGFIQVLKASEVIKYWFESQVMSKFTVWVENGVFLVMAGIKVLMILSEASLMAFVWTAFAEALAVAVLLVSIYIWKEASILSWQPNFPKAKRLLRDSWPLILSGLAIMVYMRIDQIMIGQMIGVEAVGIYSAAVRISEIWYFVPMAIVASVFPSIIEARKESKKLYYQRLQKLYDLMVILSIAIALPMTFLSTKLVSLLFGQAYISAGPILSVHIWAALFVFLGVASSKWFLLENRQILNLQRTVLGAIVNIGLNILMIPKYGPIGAAYSTVASYSFAAFFSDYLKTETRDMFQMKINAFKVFKSVKILFR